MIGLLVTVLLAPQAAPSTVPIDRAAAAPYRDAVRKYRDALKRFEQGEWTAVIEAMTEILEDGRITHRDCLLKLQNSDRTWEPPTEFLPLLLRARARLDLAKTRDDPQASQLLLQEALSDLDRSSAPAKAAVVAELAGLMKPPAPAPDGVRIPRSHAARYLRVHQLMKEASDALARSDSARAYDLATRAIEDPEIPAEHQEAHLALTTAEGVESIELRLHSTRAAAAFARARELHTGGLRREAAEFGAIARMEWLAAGAAGRAREAEQWIMESAAPEPRLAVERLSIWPAAGGAALLVLLILARASRRSAPRQ